MNTLKCAPFFFLLFLFLPEAVQAGFASPKCLWAQGKMGLARNSFSDSVIARENFWRAHQADFQGVQYLGSKQFEYDVLLQNLNKARLAYQESTGYCEASCGEGFSCR